ncbi:gliding motility-associated C-terminal domain-containing protein [Cytophaga aurantiaca]|uniref:T9SS type B sorting domain-containing protein n=1 Tax=Cytophaga aurantiaca TaxID=29530 RepID=UPI0003809555|nr:gliding motility-associated C-terminal domain-containing protein [Cytophaga aurantiaca]
MLKNTLLSFSFFLYSFLSFSQTCDPNDLYDQIISDYHSTIARRQDGSFVVWGEGKASDGVGNVLVPQQINSTNYPGLTGTPLKGALGSNTINNSQAILLTTTGLFAWGTRNIVINQVFTTSTTFQKISVAGKSDGLPPNVLPKDVKIMTATFHSLAIVTDSGHVWVIGATKELYGDGSTAGSNSWHQVRTAVGAFPILAGVVQLRMSINGVFAVDSSNNWYTWGVRVYNANAAATSYRRATLMTKPSDFPNEMPRMIAVTSGMFKITGTAYFVLSQSGNLYSMGDGDNGILGIGSVSKQLAWGRVKKNSTENLENVMFISVQEHDAALLSACAVTKENNLYYWGSNDYSSLDGALPNFSMYPVVPDGFIVGVDKANYAEKGGHTLVYVKDASDRYCYVGHRVNGSMGDGTATDTYELTMNCTNTAAVPLCSLCPATINNKLTQTQSDACAGSHVHELIGATSTLSNNNGVFYQWQSSVISKEGGFTNISSATTKNYIPKPLTQTTWYRRITSNASPNCPFDSSNVLRVSVNPIPLKPLVMTSSMVCAGDAIALLSSAATGVEYNWEGPDNFVSQLSAPVINNAAAANAGTYKLSVTDANSCVSDTASTDVAVYTIALQIITPNTVCEGLSIALEVSNPQPDWNYLWTGPNGFISDKKAPLITNASVSKMGSYSLKVTDPKCQVSESIVISLDNCENTLSIAEGFSPNGDGVNDVWVIRGLSLYPNNSIVIFNRWGEKVYSAAPYTNDWNGRCTAGLVAVGNGELLPEGTYFYLFDKNNGDAPVKGSIYIKH